MLVKKFLFVFSFISLVFFVSVDISIAEDMTVKAEGFAVKGDVDAITKAKALDKAMENAVYDVVMTMLKPDVYEKNKSYIDSSIIKRAKKYVVNYRITANGWVTHLDMVGTSEEEVIDGTLVSEGDAGVEGEILTDAEADADVDKDGPFIKSITEGVMAYHVWITAGIDMVMLKKPIASLTATQSDETSTVNIVMLDLRSFNEYSALLKKLKNVDVIKSLNYRSFTNGRYVVEVESGAVTQVLWEKLSSELGGQYIVVPSGLDSIIVKAANR